MSEVVQYLTNFADESVRVNRSEEDQDDVIGKVILLTGETNAYDAYAVSNAISNQENGLKSMLDAVARIPMGLRRDYAVTESLPFMTLERGMLGATIAKVVNFFAARNPDDYGSGAGYARKWIASHTSGAGEGRLKILQTAYSLHPDDLEQFDAEVLPLIPLDITPRTDRKQAVNDLNLAVRATFIARSETIPAAVRVRVLRHVVDVITAGMSGRGDISKMSSNQIASITDDINKDILKITDYITGIAIRGNAEIDDVIPRALQLFGVLRTAKECVDANFEAKIIWNLAAVPAEHRGQIMTFLVDKYCSKELWMQDMGGNILDNSRRLANGENLQLFKYPGTFQRYVSGH